MAKSLFQRIAIAKGRFMPGGHALEPETTARVTCQAGGIATGRPDCVNLAKWCEYRRWTVSGGGIAFDHYCDECWTLPSPGYGDSPRDRASAYPKQVQLIEVYEPHAIPLNQFQRNTLQVARKMIRDLALQRFGQEMSEPPEYVCKELSDMLGDTFHFETGEVKP